MKIVIFLGVISCLFFPFYPNERNDFRFSNSKTDTIPCPDIMPGSIQILGQNPHVPFAVVDNIGINGIRSATKGCCVKWSDTTKTWYSINEWGKIVGKAKVRDSSYYDVTDCYELHLECFEGNKGTGIYISKPTISEYPDSLKWTPSKEERKKLDKFLRTIESLTHKEESEVNIKSLFFKIPVISPNLFTKTKIIKFVIMGGSQLVMAYLNNKNEWKLSFLSFESYKYQPLTIFDINGDQIPEIMFFESVGYRYSDKILQMEFGIDIMTWKVVAESIGGATL